MHKKHETRTTILLQIWLSINKINCINLYLLVNNNNFMYLHIPIIITIDHKYLIYEGDAGVWYHFTS